MKKTLLFACLLFSGKLQFAQNVGINSTGATPDISAMLDIVAADKGLLVPRVALISTTDAVTIATPATSLLVYNTATAGISPNNVVPGYYYNSGTSGAPVWVRLATGNGASWLLVGNAGTTASTSAYGTAANNNFIGTLDARDWVIATNNLERMRILTAGQVAVGTKVSTNSAIFNIVSSAGGAPNTSTLYLSGPGQNGFGLSGVVDVFDNQATPQRNAVLGYSVGAPWYGMLNLYGSSAGTEQRMGEFDFMNRILQPADCRIATITGVTPAGVSNSGSLEFITRNAGTFISNVLWLNYDGKVGIFTRTPGYSLHVKSSTATPNLADVRVESTEYSKFSFNTSTGAADEKKWQIYSCNSVGKELRFGCLNDAETVENLWLRVIRTGFSPNIISFPLAASKVGIGTITPASKLDVEGGVSIGATYSGTTAAPANGLIVEGNAGIGTTSPAGGITLQLTRSFAPALAITNDNVPTYRGVVGLSTGPNEYGIGSVAGDFAIDVQQGKDIFFGTAVGLVNPTIQMIIKNNGFIGMGTLVPSEKLEVCGNVKVDGTISASGLINASTGIVCSSDLRFKKNIVPLSNSLSIILKLRGVNYNWRTDEFPEKSFLNSNQIGFIAQEVEALFPSLVFTDNEGYKAVDYSRLTPILVEAIKEQQVIIENQSNTTERLLLENAKMKQDLEILKAKVELILKSASPDLGVVK